MKGKVKWFNNMKAYGFIEIEEGKDVFVHRNGLSEGTSITEGDSVEFSIEDSPKGPQATNVSKL